MSTTSSLHVNLRHPSLTNEQLKKLQVMVETIFGLRPIFDSTESFLTGDPVRTLRIKLKFVGGGPSEVELTNLIVELDHEVYLSFSDLTPGGTIYRLAVDNVERLKNDYQ